MSLRIFIRSVFLATCLFCGTVFAATPVSGLPDFTRVVTDEGPAVVNISTSRTERSSEAAIPDGLANDPFFEFFRRFAPPQMRERQVGSLGSGFIISSDGYVLTNAHVVANADEIRVTLTDKREFKARVVGVDERSDVALLKISGNSLPVVRIGKSADLKVGEWVLAIGSPFGFENSVTSGIVSALGRQLPDDTSAVPFIQTDAAVNPGNSGGPLFNLAGEVVGINSQILSRSGGFMGISFAIPIDVALGISDQLKAHGKVVRSRIGITLQPLTRDLAQSFGFSRIDGALVNAVEAGGPAAKAGLRPGDIISQVDGQPVTSVADLQRLVSMKKPGSRFNLDLWRARSTVKASVVSEELRAPRKAAEAEPTAKPRASASLNLTGLTVSELSARQLAQLGVPYALLVRAVSPASARAGLAVGDVIVGLGSTPLTSAKQMESAMHSGQSSLALQVMRGGATLFIPLPLGSTE